MHPSREAQWLELTRGGQLQERLNAAMRGRKNQSASIGIAFHEFTAIAHVGTESGASDARSSPRMRAGCIAKLLTAELVARLARAGRVSLTDDIADLLDAQWRAATLALRGITVRHLLEHTHGLDDSDIARLPRRADGRIDAKRLCNRLGCAPRLSAPRNRL